MRIILVFATLWFVTAFALIHGCSDDPEPVIVYERPPGVPAPLPPGTPVPQPPAPPRQADFVTFERAEADMLEFLSSVGEQDRLNTRFLFLCDQFNEGEKAELPRFISAVDKALNSLSTERQIENSRPSDPQNCIRAFDIRDYAITAAEWRLVEKNDPFKLESFTARGLLIKQLTQSRRPWIHATNFTTIAHNNNTYYDIVGVPSNLIDFYRFVGVDAQADFDAFDSDLFLAGNFDSPIAIQKNRLIMRLDGRDGPVWSTYDTVVGRNDAGANLFENMFPIEARSNRVFIHDAQEFLWFLPNGLLGAALFNAAGVREDFAPLNIVQDVNSGGLDPTIRNSLSCYRCHSGGLIPMTDAIRNHIEGNQNFSNDDVQRARAYFKTPGGLAAAFRRDNGEYSAALQRMSVNAQDPDPMNWMTDEFRKEWSLKQAGAFFFLTPQQMTACINQSAGAREQIGQLVNGGRASLDQLIQTTPFLVRDCNLFQDPLGG